MQDRRLQLIKLANDRFDRDRASILGRRLLNEDAYGWLRDHPTLGLKDLHSLLCSPERDAVLLGEFAVTG